MRHSQKGTYSYEHCNTNLYQKYRKNFKNIFRGYFIFHKHIYKEKLKQFLTLVDNENDIKLTAMFRVLAFTININKTLALNTDKKVVVQTPKSKSSVRNISIDNQTAKILKRWKINQRERFLIIGTRVKKHQPCFTDEITNSYLYLNFMNANLKRICKNHDFKEIKVHGFRHTHCSLLFESGITIQKVQERLGHSDLKTTMSIYAHVTEKQRDNMADKFAKFMAL